MTEAEVQVDNVGVGTENAEAAQHRGKHTVAVGDDADMDQAAQEEAEPADQEHVEYEGHTEDEQQHAEDEEQHHHDEAEQPAAHDDEHTATEQHAENGTHPRDEEHVEEPSASVAQNTPAPKLAPSRPVSNRPKLSPAEEAKRKRMQKKAQAQSPPAEEAEEPQVRCLRVLWSNLRLSFILLALRFNLFTLTSANFDRPLTFLYSCLPATLPFPPPTTITACSTHVRTSRH